MLLAQEKGRRTAYNAAASWRGADGPHGEWFGSLAAVARGASIGAVIRQVGSAQGKARPRLYVEARSAGATRTVVRGGSRHTSREQLARARDLRHVVVSLRQSELIVGFGQRTGARTTVPGL